MYSFNRYRATGFGEVISFPLLRSKRSLTGVSSHGCAVVITVSGGSPFLYAAFPVGRFTFDVPCNVEFEMHFEGEGSLSLVVPSDATVVKGSPETTFTTVGHRPAINPEMAAIHRTLRDLQATVRAQNADLLQAQAKAKAAAAPSAPAVPELAPAPAEAAPVPPAGDTSPPVSPEPVKASE